MGLISASCLGQPINNNININNNCNLKITSNAEFKFLCGDNIMAPALTTESSAEHRKRSLIKHNLTNFPKLESLNCASASQGGNGEKETLLKQQDSQTTSNSDEEAALKAAADEVLGHNVDEILQVLESMESGGKCGGGGSTPGEDSMLRLLGSDLELLAGSDICGSQETEHEEISSPTPKVQVEDKLREANERQHLLERRCERLLRRVRKFQARGTGRHTAHQLQDLVTSARALLKARNASHRSHAASQNQATKEQLLDTENVKNMSAAALVTLVRKISSGTSVNQGLAQALSPDQATALRDGAGSLSFRLRHVEVGFDSDVTASSSGGESCDEATSYNPNNTGTLPICKRAGWRYGKERASVVSRWTWLQANISDLEYRIRQYSECHRQLKANKGAVRLEDPPVSTKLLQGEEGMVVNGCHSEAAATAATVSAAAVGNPEEEVAARTRPLDLSSFRKRKLVVPGVMLPKSGKRCFPPHNQPPCCRDALSMPCILCFSKRAAAMSGAQQVPTINHGRENCRERAARLDPAVHPVLSGMPDVNRSLHMAAHLRQATWQQMQLRQRGLARLGLGMKRSKASASTDLASQPTPRRKYTLHKKNNNNNTVISAKIRRKVKSRKRHRGRPSASEAAADHVEKYTRRNRKARQSAAAAGDGVGDDDLPTPSPSMLSELRAPRRKREDSYDIDNIVIPYSMAANTRVERLEYKEILTPKWRIVDIEAAKPQASTSSAASSKNGVVRPTPETEAEDISDEAVAARHEPLELDERRKFRCPPTSSRSARNRRTDSRAESSGANTPDPMSPNTGAMDVGDSPMASPRATPLPPSMLLEDSQGSKPKSMTGSKPPSLRRRTVSSQRASPEPSCSYLPPEIAPYDPRSFPLAEDVYQKMLAANEHVAPELTSSISRAPSPPPSPCGTDSTESAVPEEDDDPEWTLESEMAPSPQSNTGAFSAKASRRSI